MKSVKSKYVSELINDEPKSSIPELMIFPAPNSGWAVVGVGLPEVEE